MTDCRVLIFEDSEDFLEFIRYLQEECSDDEEVFDDGECQDK